MKADTDTTYAGIDLPSGVFIKPTNIFVGQNKVGNSNNPSKVQGLNENGIWEDLATLTFTDNRENETFNISNNNYYSKFRLKLARRNVSYASPRIYEFQITAGTIRTEV